MNSKKKLFRFLTLLVLKFLILTSATTGNSPLPDNGIDSEPKASLQEKNPEKKKLPPLKPERPRSIDVKHVAIDLRFDWKKKQAYGFASVTLSPLKTTNKVALDAAMFTINSVTLSSGKSLKYEYAGGDINDNLRITLDRNYKSDESITVKIEYRTNWVNELDPNTLAFGGNLGKGLRFSEKTTNDPIKPKEIWSMGDPESNRHWFPGYDSPNDLRTTEFTATVDKDLTAISNGRLVSVKNNPDGTRTFHYKTDVPYANYLTSFVVGEYVNVIKKYEDIELHNFGYPQEKDWVDASTERLPDMVRFFTEKTGVKYPYTLYSQVFVQDIGGFAGNNSISTITENMVDDYPTHADYLYLWDLVEAEALAQQWFSNHISSSDWSHIWLDKAFAYYFSGLYSEYKNGRDEFLIWPFSTDHSTYLGDWASGYRHPIVTRNYEDVAAFTGDNYARGRGALVLHMLRKQLGEEKWWKAVRHYVKTSGNKTVTTDNLQRSVEQATGEKIDWFFDQWVYKMGHPIFEVTKNYDPQKKQLTLSIQQTQKTDPNNEYPQAKYFQGKLDIEIDGRIERIQLQPKAENIFTFVSAEQPRFVNFDFESTWIKEIKFEKSFDELLYQFQNSKDILARRAAMLELVNLAKGAKTSAEQNAKIHSAFRETIAGNSYWRLRAAAIGQLRNFLGTSALDEADVKTILDVIAKDRSWTRASAISFLGATGDPKYADLYISYLNDPSFRVINNAAIALGKTKSPKAFDELAKLVNKPSMKSQSLLCAFAGLIELGDPRGFDLAYKALSDRNLPRWRLPLPNIWDYRVTAAQTIAALGKSEAAFPMIFERFKQSMNENDREGIFYNAILIMTLADPRGQEAFDLAKPKFKEDANALQALDKFETQFKEALKK